MERASWRVTVFINRNPGIREREGGEEGDREGENGVMYADNLGPLRLGLMMGGYVGPTRHGRTGQAAGILDGTGGKRGGYGTTG